MNDEKVKISQFYYYWNDYFYINIERYAGEQVSVFTIHTMTASQIVCYTTFNQYLL
jgi:hypothetical protein